MAHAAPRAPAEPASDAHDPTEDLLHLSRQLRRRSVAFLNHVETDAQVLQQYEAEMDTNLEKVRSSRRKVGSLARQHRSVGWLDLLTIVGALVLAHVGLSVFMALFPK